MPTLGFGAYIPGSSPVHELNAQVKIILACAFSVALFFVETWTGLAVFALFAFAAFAASRVPVARALGGLKPVAFILVFTVLAQALYGDWLRGLFFAARIALLVGACSLLTFTTSQLALVDALRVLLGPLRRVCLPVDDIALTVSLALRFVPDTVREAQRVVRAQQARCAPFGTGGLLARTKAWAAVLTPLFVRLFSRSGEVAQALAARAYRAEGRSYVRDPRLRASDAVTLTMSLSAFIMVCVLL